MEAAFLVVILMKSRSDKLKAKTTVWNVSRQKVGKVSLKTAGHEIVLLKTRSHLP